MIKQAWIVDLDGTLALRGDRNPYRWDRVGEDEPNVPVIVATQAIAAHPSAPAIVLVSGRDESCRRQTTLATTRVHLLSGRGRRLLKIVRTIQLRPNQRAFTHRCGCRRRIDESG